MDDTKCELISRKIKLKRYALGYSQEYMAQQLGISQNVYSKNERDVKNIPLIRIIQIASILNVSVSRLLK